MTTKHWIIVLCLCTLCGGIGFSLGARARYLADYYTPMPVRVGKAGWPEWPSRNSIIQIDVDMYCWISPESHGQRFRASVRKDDPRPEVGRAFDILLHCLTESTPVSTNGVTDETGYIDLILSDHRKVRIHAERYHHLTLWPHSTVLIYDAETFERYVKRHGECISKTLTGFP